MTERSTGSDEPADASHEDGSPSGSRSEHHRSFAREFPVIVLLALVAAILIKTFLVQAFSIPSVSMVPTLEVGDRILVNRLAYRFGNIERGDIVVFSDPHPTPSDRGILGAFVHWLGQGIGITQPANKDFVKRVIGLPGDVVEIRHGVTYVNGKKLHEPYLNPAERDTRSFGPYHVPAGMLFMMGDNRLESEDSRFPPPEGLGFVPVDKVIGQAFVRVWPPSRIGTLH